MNDQRKNKGTGCGCFTFIIIIVFIIGGTRLINVFADNRNIDNDIADTYSTELITEAISENNEPYNEETTIQYTSTGSSIEDEAEYSVDIIDEYNLYDYRGFGITSNNPATNINDIQETIQCLAMHEVPSPITVYVSGIEEESVREVYKDFDDTLISILSYNYVTREDSVDYIEFDYVRNDSYYVYKNIVEGVDIPGEEGKALEITSVVSEFINDNINSNMSEYDIELTIHDYLVSNTEYGHADEFYEDEHSPYGALMDHVAVCEGYAKAYELLSICCGLESKLVYGTTSNGNHVWNISKIDGVWYQVDVTWDDPTGDAGDYDFGISHAFFNINDTYLNNLDHSWNRDYYPICESIQENYYVRSNGLLDYNDFVSLVSQNAISGNTMSVAVSDYSQGSYNLNDIVISTGYVGSWTWTKQLGEDVTGYQVINIYFH